jgi:hypothetical protein
MLFNEGVALWSALATVVAHQDTVMALEALWCCPGTTCNSVARQLSCGKCRGEGVQSTIALLPSICACSDASVAVQPADSRAVVFNSVEAAHKFWWVVPMHHMAHACSQTAVSV